ncbi:GNAT family N-acetyltransferase [bacterium]|nr:GNAT family N-acetyltransferase [bacterium]
MICVYSGQLVRIRPLRDADEYAQYVLDQGIELNPYWGNWYQSQARSRRDFDECGMLSTGSYSTFAIERLDSGEMIGVEEYGMSGPACPRAWIGTFVGTRHRGRRFGVEAKQLVYCYLFENFPLERVYADTVENHIGAAKGLKLSGMRYEGRHRKCVLQNGRWLDTVNYAIHREEWEAMPYRHSVQRGPAH